MIKQTLLTLGLGLALVMSTHAAPAPNIILMVVDDLGWQDVKCYDIDEPSPMETPNIDALAKRGVLFRNGYSPAATCAPSRCAIMSGNHPARAQNTHVMGGNPPSGSPSARLVTPWYSGRMPENELTLAKILRGQGYATGHTGKWHMAMGHFSFPGPLDQGFEITSHRNGFDVRGVQSGMKNRLEGFATDQPGDPYRILQNTTYPSWGYSIDQGATTIWERWNSYSKDKGFGDVSMNSFNHYSLGAVGEWMFRSILGIETDGAGFKKILMKPELGEGITWAKGHYDSIRGRIGSDWKIEDSTFDWKITIPPNTTATVFVPAKDAAGVTESGQPAAEAKGVKFLRMENDRAVFEVASGNYEFRSRL